jgi:hypothetical protein
MRSQINGFAVYKPSDSELKLGFKESYWSSKHSKKPLSEVPFARRIIFDVNNYKQEDVNQLEKHRNVDGIDLVVECWNSSPLQLITQLLRHPDIYSLQLNGFMYYNGDKLEQFKAFTSALQLSKIKRLNFMYGRLDIYGRQETMLNDAIRQNTSLLDVEMDEIFLTGPFHSRDSIRRIKVDVTSQDRFDSVFSQLIDPRAVLSHLEVILYNAEYNISGLFRALLQNNNSKLQRVDVARRGTSSFRCDDEFAYLVERDIYNDGTIKWSPQIRQHHIDFN